MDRDQTLLIMESHATGQSHSHTTPLTDPWNSQVGLIRKVSILCKSVDNYSNRIMFLLGKGKTRHKIQRNVVPLPFGIGMGFNRPDGT